MIVPLPTLVKFIPDTHSLLDCRASSVVVNGVTAAVLVFMNHHQLVVCLQQTAASTVNASMHMRIVRLQSAEAGSVADAACG
jgi:hypothetical protein